MKTVVELTDYIAAADDVGLSEGERAEIALAVATDPTPGDLMVGTGGGARKFRWAAKGKGKSGGVRVISYYPGADHVYLVDVFAKSDKGNLSKSDRNGLKKLTSTLE